MPRPWSPATRWSSRAHRPPLYTGWKTAELFAEAGLPPGVFNYVSGPGRTVGQELQDNPDIAGWTFTGSYDVGMQVARNALSGAYPRPAIIEMGGKNPTIVSNTADLEKATTGVHARSLWAGRPEVLGLFARLRPGRGLR